MTPNEIYLLWEDRVERKVVGFTYCEEEAKLWALHQFGPRNPEKFGNPYYYEPIQRVIT